jgi:hypothetical protein
MWAGLLIVIAVTGYALFDWALSTVRTDAYYEGLAAVESRDWDRAASAFGRADGYRDATLRKQQVADKIAERDHLYDQALQAFRLQRWQEAIDSIKRLQDIQPGFGDSAELMSQARTNALRQGLAGIVYLVSDGQAPGLYVRDAQGGANLLPGSDGNSMVRAISDDGTRLVYDRSNPFKELCSPHGPTEGDTFISPYNLFDAERVLALARLDREGRVLSSAVLADLDAAGSGVFTGGPGSSGLWWYSSGSGPVEQGAVRGMSPADLFYYDLSKREAVQVSDVAAGRRVVAIDPSRPRVVIAAGMGDPRGASRYTALYMAGAAGQDARLLQVVPGEVYRASISADGKWLLYNSQQNGDAITRTVWLLNLDVPGARPAMIDRLAWQGIQLNQRLSASFLPPGPDGRVRVVVNRIEGNVESLSIYDVNDPDICTSAADSIAHAPGYDPRSMFRLSAAYTEPSQPGSAQRRDLSGFSHDGLYIGSRRQEGGTARLEVFGGTSGITSTVWVRTPLPAYPGQITQTQFTPHDDYLLVSVYNPDGIDRGHVQAIYSARIQGKGELDRPTPIAMAVRPYEDLPVVALPPAGTMLAYVDPAQELRAVSFDGSESTVVAHNVRAVWSLKPHTELIWAR